MSICVQRSLRGFPSLLVYSYTMAALREIYVNLLHGLENTFDVLQ